MRRDGSCSGSRPPAGSGAYRGRPRRRSMAGVVTSVLVLLTLPAAAHWIRPDDVLAELRTPAVEARYGVVGAGRNPELTRLLVVRVDRRWHAASAADRRRAAEEWRTRWRHAVAQGIVAIVDEATQEPVINFDAHGHAVLRTPTPEPGMGH